MNLAAIDCGTNAIRILIASVDGEGRLQEHARIMRIVRLGEGVDRTGEFAADALDRTFAACDEYARVIDAAGVSEIRFVATSASRDARNRDAFVDGVRSRLGVEPEVISGQEEAELSFVGAVRGLPTDLLDSPVLVTDIGGGSTEFVLGTLEAGSWRVDASISVDIGCVRLTERHLHSDPPTAAEINAAESDIERALDRVRAAVPLDQAQCLVGLAGSVTTVSAMAMDLDRYDADRIHGSAVASDVVSEVTTRLLAMTRAERAALPFMHPGRVDVIGGGAMVLRAIARSTGVDEVLVSECDLLDGIAYRLAGAANR
jgi:exopolyphosphatase/guanosine-5'-triphosphate,3'-diphosphate pyrophosphatase